MWPLSKPFPCLWIGIAWIIYAIDPDSFKPGGWLADVGSLLSQWAYVIRFGFQVWFVSMSDIQAYNPKLTDDDFTFLMIWSFFT